MKNKNNKGVYNPQISNYKDDLIFEEVARLLDTVKDIKIKTKYVESIPEDRLELESQNILRKFAIRRLSCFAGQGAFNYGTWHT